MDLAERWDLPAAADYVLRHGHANVTLQFPDDLLQHAPAVAAALQAQLAGAGSDARVFVLADTSYNPLSVDEVAAAHVNADCVIHFGYASLNPVSRTPALCVLPKLPLDGVAQAGAWLAQQLAEATQQQQQQVAVVCCDQGYLHLLPELRQAVQQAYQGPLQLVFADSAPVELQPQGSLAAAPRRRARDGCGSSSCCLEQQPAAADDAGSCCRQPQPQPHEQLPPPLQQQQQQQQQASGGQQGMLPSPIGGLVWQLPARSQQQQQQQQPQPLMVWLGPADSPALTQLQLTHSTHAWLRADPASRRCEQGLAPGLDRLLKRRYYYVERARGASMVGLLVGTLGAAGYLTALNQLRKLAARAGKTVYTLLMGKPSPAKLANFPELEVIVLLAEPAGLLLDCADYLAPLITPHEAFLAFSGRPFDAAAYRLDFGDLLDLAEGGDGGGDAAAGAQQAAGAAAAAAAVAAAVGGNVCSDDGDNDDDDARSEVEGSEQQQQQQQQQRAGAIAAAGSAVPALAAGVGSLVVAGTGALGAGSRTGGAVTVRSAAQYLAQQRTYKGLETPATGAELKEAALAVEGRAGRAAGYADEPAA